MNRRRVYASALAVATILSLAGCKGHVEGTDALVVAEGYNQGGPAMLPSLPAENTTQVEQKLSEFVEACLNSDFDAAFAMLALEDTTFVTAEGLSKWFASSGITRDSKIEEVKRDDGSILICRTAGSEYEFIPVEDENGQFKYSFDAFVQRDFKVLAPEDMPISMDGVDLKDYATTINSDGLMEYIIPCITATPHSIVVKTVVSDITCDVTDLGTPYDVRNRLNIDAKMRETLRKNYVPNILTQMNEYIIANDWDGFISLWDPSLDMQKWNQAFRSGNVTKMASKTYGLKCTETRDLQEDDGRMMFVGYDTIYIRMGTKWTWASADDVKVDKETGEQYVPTNKWNTMTMRNTITLKLTKDPETAGTVLYIVDIDADSITTLAPGKTDW